MNDSFFGRLKDLFYKPGRLMENVGARPAWWQPGLLIFLVAIAVSYATMPIAVPEQAELMRDSWLMDFLPAEAAEQAYEDARDLSEAKRALNSFNAGFMSWMGTLLFGLVLGFFARLAGGEGKFSQALGIVSWGAVPVFVVSSLVKLPLVMATESVFAVHIGLAALFPGLEPGDALWHFLIVYGDFFSWWGLVLLVIGFENVFGLARSAAIPSVVLPWALLSTLQVVGGLLTF